eukprot:9416589-Alexandrium_andersonii.AAC.1
MSASLVGSEMCIRDRSLAASADLGPAQTTLKATFGRVPVKRNTRATTVSYTHLTLPTICSV